MAGGGGTSYSFKETCNYDVKPARIWSFPDVVSDYDTFL